ncbi:hypothetical protein OV079_02965 [Nannocystis pusilla]|uniref:Uncharacterized protein n=1 Tax=Nannocystis pusilla TaxID=889268 RepID=A0A9X3EIZ1_9BACT|nr:hypothetical protein [Nannocystis pusilla]
MVDGVAVVAGLAGVDDAVAAHRTGGASIAAFVVVDVVAVVAGLAGADVAVAADGQGAVELAGGVVAVFGPVVAFFAGIELTVAAGEVGRGVGDMDRDFDATVTAGGQKVQRRRQRARIRAANREVLRILHLFATPIDRLDHGVPRRGRQRGASVRPGHDRYGRGTSGPGR